MKRYGLRCTGGQGHDQIRGGGGGGGGAPQAEPFSVRYIDRVAPETNRGNSRGYDSKACESKSKN